MPTVRLHKASRVGRQVPAAASTRSRRARGASRRPPPSSRIPDTATIRRQYVRCGKCPLWHGPYWYAFWQVPGTRETRSAYIGSDRALARLIDARGGRRLPVDEDLGEAEP